MTQKDDNTAATKKDIQGVNQNIQMILDTMGLMEERMDQKFENFEEKIEAKFEAKFEESHRHTAILIEDLEERVFGTNNDQFSLQDDKIQDHESQITKLETTSLVTS